MTIYNCKLVLQIPRYIITIHERFVLQIPRYIITIHELLAHTPHDHVERKSLEFAQSKLEELSQVTKHYLWSSMFNSRNVCDIVCMYSVSMEHIFLSRSYTNFWISKLNNAQFVNIDATCEHWCNMWTLMQLVNIDLDATRLLLNKFLNKSNTA